MGDTGFIYRIVCTVMQGMSVMVSGVCLEMLLTGRNDRISRRKRLLFWFVFSFVSVGIKCLIPVPAILISLGTPVIMSLCYVLFLKYCYSDKGWIKLIHAAMLLLQNVLADVIQDIVWGRRNIDMLHNPFAQRNMAEVSTTIAAISIMINISYTVIMLKIQKKKRVKISPVWVAVMLLLIFIFAAMQIIQISGETPNWYFIFRCVFTVAEFSTLMLYLSQWEKREVQEEIDKLQQAMELEKVHYEQIEARREEMAKIRHDYNNVITSVLFLIENGRMDEAGNVVKDLSERMSRTREYPFCGVPIINAVLAEKQRECEKEGISLKVDLQIPASLAVVDLDLCMVFGNLMDNAIRSCKEWSSSGNECGIMLKDRMEQECDIILKGRMEQECSILLTGRMVQEYLIVKCQNTSLENRERKIKGSGYGHKILTDIAGKYDGDFQTGYEDGIFTAQISLKMQ